MVSLASLSTMIGSWQFLEKDESGRQPYLYKAMSVLGLARGRPVSGALRYSMFYFSNTTTLMD